MNWFKAFIYLVLIVIIGTLTVAFVLTKQQNVHQAKQIEHQSAIIDSLLARRMKVFDVHLHVTDNSKNNIYGRYNKGTITIPAEKTYILDIDSLSIK